MGIRESVERRLALRVEQWLSAENLSSPCLILPNKPHWTGYVLISVGNRKVLAHRAIWEHFNGPIPLGLQIDHICKIKPCANEEHIEPVTQLVNLQRRHGGAGTETHCLRGHELSGYNLRFNATGRVCRKCELAAGRRYREREKAKEQLLHPEGAQQKG